jgi:L-malate glycosyltransferase
MKILFTVESYFPAKGGMAEVVKQLAENLTVLGHDITIATHYHDDRERSIRNKIKVVEFYISGNLVTGLKGDIGHYKLFLTTSNYDVILVFAAQQWASDIFFQNIKNIPGKKIFIPTGFSALYQTKYQEYFDDMKEWLKKFDMNIFHSNDYRDITFARENNIENLTVIPNGANQKEFSEIPAIDIRARLNIPKNNFLILHVGSHTGAKGHAELIKIFKTANIKNSTCLIIGNDSAHGCLKDCRKNERLFKYNIRQKLANKRLILADLSRAETLAAYQEADLFLFPSNVECSPLVLFEAMASKTPFLTSACGNAQEIIDLSNGGILLPTDLDEQQHSHVDIKSSAAILADIHSDNTKRQELGTNGFKAWQKNFTWELIAKKYETLFKSLLDN